MEIRTQIFRAIQICILIEVASAMPLFSAEAITTIPRRALIQGFTDKYQIVQKPRIVIYINRNPVISQSGSQDISEQETLPPAEARIIDEHFAAPFFEAGARFVDEELVASLQRAYDSTGNFLHALTRSHERAYIEFIRKNADIAIELRVEKKQTEYNPQKESPYRISAIAYDLRLPGNLMARATTDEIEIKAPTSGRRSGAAKTPLQEQIDQLSLLLMQRLIPALYIPEA